MFDWGEDGIRPNKIWGFVDLSSLPASAIVKYNELLLEPGIYAIVEDATISTDEELISMSEIFVPITKEVGGITQNRVSHLSFYLADVEGIVKPVAVIPDLGGAPNSYFMVKDRETWKTDFMDFLEKELDLDEVISDDEEEDSSEIES